MPEAGSGSGRTTRRSLAATISPADWLARNFDRPGERQTHRLRRWLRRRRSLAQEPSVAPLRRFLFGRGMYKRISLRRCPLVPRWFPLASPSLVAAWSLPNDKARQIGQIFDPVLSLL